MIALRDLNCLRFYLVDMVADLKRKIIAIWRKNPVEPELFIFLDKINIHCIYLIYGDILCRQ